MRIAVVVLVAALGAAPLVPGTAYAGGDEPSGGERPNRPPGPWSTDRARGRPYRASGTRRCDGAARPLGARVRILGVFVRGERCRRAVRLVRAYQRCGAPACFRVRRRCVQPAFLGGCRRSERFYYRSVGGYPLRRAPQVPDPLGLRRRRRVRARRAAGRPRLHALHLGPDRGRHRAGAARGVGEPADAPHRHHARHRPARLRDRRSDARVVRPGRGRRPRPHAAPGLLREAPAAPGRDGLRRAAQRDADPRRQRRPGRGGDDARRDHGHRLEGPAEPRRGAGRRDHVAAPGDDHPLGHHRQPRQRRRRRRLRPPRRHPGLRLDPEREPRRRLGRRARLDRRHPRRPLAPGRQHDRRRRRRDLHGRGRRRHRDRLDGERQRRRRPRRRDLHARRRRHDHQLDAHRQPRRRPRRRGLGRGVGDRRSTRRSRATSPSRTSAAGCGRAGRCTSATRRSATTTPRARAAACTPAACSRSSTRRSPTTSRPSPRTSASASGWRRSAR